MSNPITPTARALPKSFEPATFERELYDFWMENGCFHAHDENAPGQVPYVIMIPPPNVTGSLHMGHALTNTIQDILVRWRRMKGDNVLWMPGTDHAGIATQTMVEKQIAKEGKGPTGRPLTRHDVGREKFLERTWKWKEESGGQIVRQLRRLGSSLDWERERFTMDEGFSRAVREVFVRLYKENLIYRGERIINWCPRCQTALSDLEVNPTERKSHLWHLRYKIVEKDGSPLKGHDGSAAELVIATTRPETLLGDTAVAVHPEDERYTQFHGKMAVLPLTGRLIPVITDEYVDRAFGSGALKITPAHDFNDSEIGKRHGLPVLTVMDKTGFMSPEAAPYQGLKYLAGQGKTSEVREKILTDLTAAGLIAKIEDHVNKVGLCQRCDSVAEPLVSKQWFVKIEPLAKPAIAAVESGRIEFTPKSWEKTYFEWMYNIRDWCISRQLWWGHQIPAWYCGKCEGVTVFTGAGGADTAPDRCEHCGADPTRLKRDEDVLDTWFSSGLWPFATLGWPEKTKALETFYPGSVLETGFDIIFFWVARMIMMGLHFMDEVPFKKVYLHAMVRDEKGEKMSKTKGNVIDPLVLIDQHGADPLRFTLAAMAGQGRDIKLSGDRVEGYRAFANKLWNAVKFFHLQLDPATGFAPAPEPEGGAGRWLIKNRFAMLPQNKWILSRLQTLIQKVDGHLDRFELNEAAHALYEFTWHEFCDWYIEFAKLPLREESTRLQTIYTLRHTLEALLRLMHPFMPFVTEELWQSLPWKRPAQTPGRKLRGEPEIFSLMLKSFPEPLFKEFRDAEAETTIATLKTVVEAIRNFRGENNISPKADFAVGYSTASSATDAFFRLHAPDIQAMARVSSFAKTLGSSSGAEAVIPLSTPPVELRIRLAGLVNVDEESKRIQKEIEKVESDLQFVRNKLSQDTFKAKAPPELVAKEQKREQELLAKKVELETSLARLQKLAQ